MKKVEHIGIAVKDLKKANKIFEKIFGRKNYKEEIVESQGVKTSFFKLGNNKIELISSINKKSPINKFLEKNKEGIHHIAFDVDDINKEMIRIEKAGIRLLSKTPLIGADKKLICFLNPKDTNGVLIELCQDQF